MRDHEGADIRVTKRYVSFVSSALAALRKHPLWRDASEMNLRTLCSKASDLSLAPGELLIVAGTPADTVYLLVEGVVRVFHPLEQGGEFTVKLFGAPAAFGDSECTLRLPRSESTQALTAVRVLAIPAVHYFRMLQAEPSACFRAYWDLGRRFAITLTTERSVIADSLPGRVVAVLLAYANQFGIEHEKGTLIDFPLTREDLSRQVGATPRTLVRALTTLYRSRALGRVGRRYLIADREKLIAVAGEAPRTFAMRSDDRPWAEK